MGPAMPLRRCALGAAALVVLVAGSAPAGDSPDFGGVIVTAKMHPVSGVRRVLAVLWDPHRPDHPAPHREAIEKILFGPRPSVADWYRENSGGKLTLEKAGVLGWYDADKPAEHYWDRKADDKDADGDGWVNGHVEKWAEALRKAEKEFDFAKYDANHDKVLQPEELGILVVIPQKEPFGTNRGPAGRQLPKWEPLVLDGVRIPVVAEWYTGSPPNLGAPAHELCHLLLGAPDLYFTTRWPYAAGYYSNMDYSYGSVHLDPFEKIKLGWAPWEAVSVSGRHRLKSVEEGGKVLVLHSPRRGPQEYFLLENRWRWDSYDAGVGKAGRGIPSDGLAVWNILEDPKDFDSIESPAGKGEWGRRGIRMIRSNGGIPVSDISALFAKEGTVLDDDSKPASLRWFDGSPSGFQVTLLGGAGPEMDLQVRVGP
jgi:M6 family metalloprotease-like protein